MSCTSLFHVAFGCSGMLTICARHTPSISSAGLVASLSSTPSHNCKNCLPDMLPLLLFLLVPCCCCSAVLLLCCSAALLPLLLLSLLLPAVSPELLRRGVAVYVSKTGSLLLPDADG